MAEQPVDLLAALQASLERARVGASTPDCSVCHPENHTMCGPCKGGIRRCKNQGREDHRNV